MKKGLFEMNHISRKALFLSIEWISSIAYHTEVMVPHFFFWLPGLLVYKITTPADWPYDLTAGVD